MLIAAGLIIAGAIVLMVRRVDVRLVLLGAGLAMAVLAGRPLAIADTFTRAMVTAMVAPICASMGFAALMQATGCDRHLVHALLAPVRRLPWLASALPVVRAMLVGAALTVVVAWREVLTLTRAFFEGMGAAYASIISLTITAQCFGAGVAAVGLADALLRLASESDALVPLAAGFPWALAALSGSGSGPVLAFAQTFLTQVSPGDDRVTLGAVACLGGAFGRTMSPVSAVVVYGSGLVGVPPTTLVRHLLPALLAGGAVALAVALR